MNLFRTKFFTAALFGLLASACDGQNIDATTEILASNVIIESHTNALTSDNLQDALDSEMAIDAPIDGFALGPDPENLEAAKAFLKCVATPEAQVVYVTSPGIGSVAVSPQADTSNYTTLQAASAEVLQSAGSIAQFLDRDARADFAGPSGMQGFLIDFLSSPEQDLDAFLNGIQAYYDSLPPEA